MEFLAYARGLEFTDAPDYNKIIGLFETAKRNAGFDMSTDSFCWTKILDKERKQEM